MILVTIAAIAYHGFIFVLLLSGGGDDQKAGFLFCLNSPLFALWILGLFRLDERSPIAGFAVAGMQVLIHALMLAMGIGDVETVWFINGCILLGLTFLAGICWSFGPSKGTRHTSVESDDAAGSLAEHSPMRS